ncbi:putative motility protein [Roseateles terrae]|uniref:Motility protein n=1 Tax=Roseateles terrae TaxID=431060 RepID=A0ABR6GMI7_9BURK|nr:putative motility protein [Roseateles terrae]MBB3193337.1 hypothetical protein [Roseateles terrae]
MREFAQALPPSADNKAMDITSASTVSAAVSSASNAAPGTTAQAASLLVLRKALDVQQAGALALLDALPPQPALATEGPLGRNLNVYA